MNVRIAVPAHSADGVLILQAAADAKPVETHIVSVCSGAES